MAVNKYIVIVVNDKVQDYGTQIFLQIMELGLEIEMDINYDDTLDSRLMAHKNNFIICLGHEELQSQTLSIRLPNDNQSRMVTLENFVNSFVMAEN